VAESAQRKLKSAWVRDAFAELIDDDTQWQPCTGQPGLRRRVRWFVGRDADGRFLGFHARNTHTPVRHEACPVLEPALNLLRGRLEAELPAQVASVQATLLHDGMHVVLESEHAPPRHIALPAWPQVQWWWRQGDAVQPLNRPVRPLHDLLPAGEREVSLAIGPMDFVQGSRLGNHELVRQLQRWLPERCRRIVDLFCGAGNLSLPAAVACGARVLGAEGNAASVRAAMHNARRLHVVARFEVADLFRARLRPDWVAADLLILDPPRKGARALCARMHELMPRRIVLISCDVAAGARDARLLHRHGYRLRALRALDMFPCAGHVETLSLWSR